MGFRARKSIKVVPGVRLNLSKTGIGASFGAGGPIRYSVHSSGRRTVSASTGVPGVYYQQSVRDSGDGPSGATPAPTDSLLKKPGLFAPKSEKELYKAIKAQDAQAVQRVGDHDANLRLTAYSLAGLMLASKEPVEAARLLAESYSTGKDPADDKFVSRYVGIFLKIPIAEGISALLPMNRDAVGLSLAELLQHDDKPEEAIDVVEQLEPTTYAAVSLAELYAQVGRYDDVVDLTNGVSNEDDASALLLVFRAIALREQGYPDGAHEAFKEALKSRSRAPAVRHLALSERAKNYLAQGKKAQARKDLEKILAEDSEYEGIRERISELT
jgi:tetratricopeptide (TPR) repeat protein